MQNYQNTVENSATGSPVSNVTITVKVYPPPGANATIYSVNDVGATPIAGSSVVTDQYGQFGFYAANGTYYFVLTEANGTITTTGPIVIQDPGLPQKAIPIDADKFVYADSTTAFSGVFATWANLKSMWDGLYVRLANLAASGGSALVGHLPGGTGAVATTVQAKQREIVSIFDFMTAAQVADVQSNTASLDITAAEQTAITASYALGRGVNIYYPPGTYLKNGNTTMGNTASTCGVPITLCGEYRNSIIKTTAVNVNPYLFQGPHPDVDGAGNRTSNVKIENLKFVGPGASGVNTNSIAMKFYGVQGITLLDTYCTGWYCGEYYQNVDLVNRFNVWLQGNYNGTLSEATGYALNSSLNSFNSYGGQVGNNTNYGMHYLGGVSPGWYGVNFTVNGTSLVMSPNHAGGGMVTVAPVVSGCYFEGDTGTSIILGGGNGIVRSPIIEGGFMISASATPLITVANASNSAGRGQINIGYDISFPGSSFITQASSAGKVDTNTNLNNVNIGDIVRGTGRFIDVRSGAVFKPGIASAASVDILSFGSYGAGLGLTLTVTSQNAGGVSTKKYAVSMIGGGGGGASSIGVLSTEDYPTPAPFTLSVTANSPVAGTNKLTLTNNSASAASFWAAYTVEFNNGGTLTEL